MAAHSWPLPSAPVSLGGNSVRKLFFGPQGSDLGLDRRLVAREGGLRGLGPLLGRIYADDTVDDSLPLDARTAQQKAYLTAIEADLDHLAKGGRAVIAARVGEPIYFFYPSGREADRDHLQCPRPWAAALAFPWHCFSYTEIREKASADSAVSCAPATTTGSVCSARERLPHRNKQHANSINGVLLAIAKSPLR